MPVALAARLCAIPYITHDTDALPGLANRIAGRWAKFHAVALPAQYYPYPRSTIREVGVPVDIRFKPFSTTENTTTRLELGYDKSAQILFITGGSNGARRLNAGVIKIIPELLDNFKNLHIVHQVGAGNENQYKNLDDKYLERLKYFGFTSEQHKYSGIADVVITRAGGTALAELAAQKKACVVVPNPYLTGGHQLKNAQVYQEANAAVVLTEAQLKEDNKIVIDTISRLINDEKLRKTIGGNLHNLMPRESAAHNIVKLINEIAIK